jgi:hypothetical protein
LLFSAAETKEFKPSAILEKSNTAALPTQSWGQGNIKDFTPTPQ